MVKVILRSVLIIIIMSYYNNLRANHLIRTSQDPKIDSLINLANEHHMWAVKNYKIDGLLDSVIRRANISLDIRRQLYADQVNIDLGKSYHNLGAFYKLKGNYDRAKSHLKEAVKIFENLSSERTLRSLLEIGKIYKLEGDYVSSEDYFQLAIELAKKEVNVSKLRSAVVDLGSIYIDTNRDSLAIELFETYRDDFDIDQYNSQDIFGKFYNNLASAYLHNDDYEKAVITYETATMFDTSDYLTQSKIYTNLATAHRLLNNDSKCLEMLKKGVSFAYRSNDTGVISFSHKGLGKYYEYKGELSLALEEYQASIGQLIPSFLPTDNIMNPSVSLLEYVERKIDLLSYLSDKVRVLISIDDEIYKREIIELFKLGDMLIGKMRNDHFVDNTKLYWREEVFPFYEAAISYCHDKNASEEAFYFFEKSKAVLLLEGYSFNKAISTISELDQARYKHYKSEIENRKQKDKTIESFVSDQKNFEDFLDSLNLRYPTIFNSNKKMFYSNMSEFQRNNLQDSSSMFVHYFWGENDVYAFFIDREKVEFVILGSTHLLDSLTRSLTEFFTHPAMMDNEFESYKQLSYDLYKKVLGDYIEDGHTDLIIVPDGLFSFIPFESLVTSNIKSGEKLKYVIHDRTTRYSFSGSLLTKRTLSNFDERHDIVTFMPFGDDDKMKEVKFSGFVKKNFQKSLKRAVRIKTYEGLDASKKNLLSINKGIPIIHLSSHGFSYENEEPRILLSNSSIKLTELYASILPSELVFLSACKTSIGQNTHGEGIQSMARAFTFAGANSVISSLWNVVADPNSKIVEEFYNNLGKGYPKFEALHLAKLNYLANENIPQFEKSPYYWSGLVYYGDENSINFKPRYRAKQSLYIVIISMTSLIILLFGYWKFQR